MTYVLVVVAALGLALGIGGLMLGEAGDAPELQLAGVVLVTAAVWLGVRVAQRGR